MKKSHLKRTFDVFEDFAFHDEPITNKPSETALKFQKLARGSTIQSLLSDDEIVSPALKTANSLNKNNSSQESPWLEKRIPSKISEAEKARNIAKAIQERKKSGKNELMEMAPSYKFQKFVEETEFTRITEDLPERKNSLDKILSKSNLIRTSLLNKSLDDLDDYDPVDKYRNKVQEQRSQLRQDRIEQRHVEKPVNNPVRKPRVVLDSDEEDDYPSNMKEQVQNNFFVDNHEDNLEDSFQLDDEEEISRSKNNLKKLGKSKQISKPHQQQQISLLDSDEDKKKKKKKSKKSKVVEIESDDAGEDDDESNDERQWNDDELTSAELRQKAFGIIKECEDLAKNLKNSLFKWEGKGADHAKNDSAAVPSSVMKDCVNLIEIRDDSEDDEPNVVSIRKEDDDDDNESDHDDDDDYEDEDSDSGAKKQKKSIVDKTPVKASSSINLLDTPVSPAVHSRHAKLINNGLIQELCPSLTLNNYQLVGVNWMRLLYQNLVNGVLADDMGLGKTIQTIAFLTYLSKSTYLQTVNPGKAKKLLSLPHLIIVPASVLSNWENEFEKFAPSMRLIKYHGSQNERQELKTEIKSLIRNGELNILLTTYTIFERESNKSDRSFLNSLLFHFLVLDEAHSIKNINSSRYVHINNLNSKNRLLLSGTPVQNNIMELLSLLSFLMPKIFLKENCELLIEVFGWGNTNSNNSSNNSNKNKTDENMNKNQNRLQNQQTLNELKSILFPFVLRRLKLDVLNQLTEKKIIVKKLPLTSYQTKIYDQMIDQFMKRKHSRELASIKQRELEERNEIKNPAKMKKKSKNNNPPSNPSIGVDGGGIIDLSDSPMKTATNSTKTTIQSKNSSSTATLNALIPEINLADDDNEQAVSSGGVACASGNLQLVEEMEFSAEALSSSEAKHLFTQLRKVCNHPLLLRVQYTAEDIQYIGTIAMQEGYFGNQCSIQQIITEISTNFSDYDIHQLCLLYPYALGKYELKEENLFQSNKILYLKELLPKLVRESEDNEGGDGDGDGHGQGHRILLFSQWTKILDILEILCNYLSLRFVRLDGSTPIRERQELIDQFNENHEIKIFLLSTKAGGLGINLTSADTVILHDLDFNPENDRQAEDRCHRIGQTRPVTVYKLVSESTVDEDIYEMGERKRELTQAVLNEKKNRAGGADGDGVEENEDALEEGEGKKSKNGGASGAGKTGKGKGRKGDEEGGEDDLNMISKILAKALNRK